MGGSSALLNLALIGGLHLGVFENVLAVVEREHVAVVEEAPDLALVGRQRLKERMVIVEIGLVEIFGDVIVERRDDAAVGERGRPCGLDVENVIGARAGDMLGDRLRILVGMREFDHVGFDAGQLLPERAGEIARVERLQTGLRRSY